MKLLKLLCVLFTYTCLHASQGFFREGIIDSASPLAVLDPVKHPEIERVVQNLRFFGNLSSRPASNVYVHYQAIQNLVVWPTSPVTALSWMLFPISPLPMINPNNIGVSDPLGKITPEQLGQLMGVITRHTTMSTDPRTRLQELYALFVKTTQVNDFVTKHQEEDLKAYYRYALIDGVNKYVHRNITPQDEDLNLTTTRQAECESHPHLLVIEAFKHSSSHLLEIPGTEILREPGETWFTEAELTTGLQTKYGGFSYRQIEKFRIAATVDMLWKSAHEAPEEILQLLSYYAWRKFSDQIFNVIMANGAVQTAQRAALSRALVNKFSKVDYQTLVARAQASEDIDGLIDSLTEGKRNLVLYGSARFSLFLAHDYGNVSVKHDEQRLAFANCAEQSLFNLTYLAQLVEQEMGGTERDPRFLPEGSPLKDFWQGLSDDDLNTTETRNRWTQAICRRSGVVYRKGNYARTPWLESNETSHWAELNPGILNQMRVLFHLLGRPEEAIMLTYEGSNEEIIEAASLRISKLLSDAEPEEENLPFIISPKSDQSDLKKLDHKKDWYGSFDITWHGKPLAVWRVDKDHSFLQITRKSEEPFALSKHFTNPYVIGQLQPFYIEINENGRTYFTIAPHTISQKIEQLEGNSQQFEIFSKRANLCNEKFRQEIGQHYGMSQHPYSVFASRLFWGKMQIDNGRESSHDLSFRGSFSPTIEGDLEKDFSKLQSVASTHCFHLIRGSDTYAQALRNYQKTQQISPDIQVLAENRCNVLHLCILASINNCTFGGQVLVQDLVRALPRTNFSNLFRVYFSLDQKCTTEDVAQIAQLLPRCKELCITQPISPEHFCIIAVNTRNLSAQYILDVDTWYRRVQYAQEGMHSLDERFYSLPGKQQECVFSLLLPLVQKGIGFEPPFIEISSDENLESVYESLRIAAAIYRPAPLMLENGENFA